MAGTPNLVAIRHGRLAPPRRSPHRTGRLTPGHVLDADPRGRTLCGAEPGYHDLSNSEARSKAGAKWLTCAACREVLELEAAPSPAGVKMTTDDPRKAQP